MNNVLAGIVTIASWCPNAVMSAEHDRIWLGKVDEVPAVLADYLISLGWWEDEETCSWTTNV